MQNDKNNISKIKKKFLLLFPLALIIIGAMLFLPAGSFGYWQAWAFIGIFFIPVSFEVSYLLKHDPSLLERRMRFEEKEERGKNLIKIVQLLFFIGILVSGLDYRFGWSNVPIWLVIVSDVIIFLGFMLVFRVFQENTYTSRILEVEKNQKVISTGPYAIIRHPMYAGIIPMYIFIPLALGSYFALIPILPSIIAIIFRIYDEERLLLKELKGYKKYCQDVKYRLIPKIW